MTGTSSIGRRAMLRIAGLGGLACLAWPRSNATEDQAALARAAYIWGLPLVQTRLYLKLAKQHGVPVNRLYGASGLATPTSVGAGPNVDTLYGLGWLDLAVQPQILSVPDTHDRYYSIQLLDAYENTFSYVGRRATGTKAGHYAIIGPNWHGTLPSGVVAIHAPTNQVLALTRTLVTSPADLPAALAVQAAYTLTPLADYPHGANALQPTADGLRIVPILKPTDLDVAFYDELSAGLAEAPPPVADHAFVKRLAALGVGPGKAPSKTDDKATIDILAAAPPAADRIVRSHKGTRNINGWDVRLGVTNFIRDPLERASVDLLGPGSHIAQEALYFFVKVGPDGQALNGSKAYMLKFPPGGLPPVDAFWSLTLYGQDWSLQNNSINRYAIGDRTAGLKRGSDGSLEIQIQHAAPSAGNANWLPAPAGQFQLVLRTYQPRAALFNGQYQLPALGLGQA